MSSSKRMAALVSLLVAGLLAATACGSSPTPTPMPTATPSPLSPTATTAPSPNTRQLTVGQELVLTLDSNPSTGYSWRLAKSPDAGILTVVGNKFQPPATPIPGAPGKDVWTFKAAGRGATQLTLEYLRPFAPNEPPAKTESYTVIVS